MVSRDDEYGVRLALAAFRYEAAVMERRATIRWVRERGSWSMATLAENSGVSVSTVRRLVQAPIPLTLGEVSRLRQRWGVDLDPASRAAADHIVAHLVSDDLLVAFHR